MSWFKELSILGLWKAGSPAPIDNDSPVPTDQRKVQGTDVSVNAGTSDAGTQRVVLPTDGDHATRAKQDTQIAAEQAVQAAVEALNTAHQSGGVTHAQLAAVIAALGNLEGYTDGLEALLAALDAKDFATSAKQLPDGHNVTVLNPTANPETGLAKEATLQALLNRQREFSESLWTDDTDAYFVRVNTIDESVDPPAHSIEWKDLSGNASAAPGAGARPVSGTDRETVERNFTATAAGTGYSDGDFLTRALVIDTQESPPTVEATVWYNVTTGAVISAPAGGTYEESGEVVGLQDSAGVRIDPATAAKQLPDNHQVTVSNQITGFATEAKLEAARALLALIEGKDFATQTTLNNLLTAVGTPRQEDGHGSSLTDRSAVHDPMLGLEILEDQSGAGAVLTFTFADPNPPDLIWVRSVGEVSRAGLAAAAPTSTKGIYCADDEPTPITLRTAELKVFAPVGTTVSVWGYRYPA